MIFLLQWHCLLNNNLIWLFYYTANDKPIALNIYCMNVLSLPDCLKKGWERERGRSEVTSFAMIRYVYICVMSRFWTMSREAYPVYLLILIKICVTFALFGAFTVFVHLLFNTHGWYDEGFIIKRPGTPG